MELREILAISGQPGLYKYVAQSTRGVIVESLLDGRRMNASASSKVSALSDISMFTEGDDIALADVFTRIYAHTGGKHAISPKETPEHLKEAFAEVLPEDKARFVEQEKAAGHTVIMLGDGINDSPALSAADVGIAISDGAAIAREIADVTVAADSLNELVILKCIANGLQKRTHDNYRFIMGFNSTLIVLGAMGILQPATSALLHNASTLGVSLKSMTNLLDEYK